MICPIPAREEGEQFPEWLKRVVKTTPAAADTVIAMLDEWLQAMQTMSDQEKLVYERELEAIILSSKFKEFPQPGKKDE